MDDEFDDDDGGGSIVAVRMHSNYSNDYTDRQQLPQHEHDENQVAVVGYYKEEENMVAENRLMSVYGLGENSSQKIHSNRRSKQLLALDRLHGLILNLFDPLR